MGLMQRKRPLCKVRPPAKPGACVSLGRASYRQASQEALKKTAACITCPTARKRAPFIQDYLSGNRKVVHLFPLRSMLEAKAFLLSPALLGGVISRKHTRQAPQGVQHAGARPVGPQGTAPAARPGAVLQRESAGSITSAFTAFLRTLEMPCSHEALAV